MPRRVKRALDRFWAAVDAEAVIVIQYVFGVVFILAGLYGIFIAHQAAPPALQDSMGGMDIRLWYWLNVIGPVTCLIGKSLHGDLDYAGRWMQLSGDLMLAMSLLAFTAGTLEAGRWGEGAYSPFLGFGFSVCAALTVTRDVRRLRSIERGLK